MPKVRAANRPRFRLLPTLLLTVAILGLPSAVYAWGRSSSSFKVQRVAVGGTDLVPQKQVLRLLRQEYLGRNLFTITAADVSETLSPLCYVARAGVDRDFPDTLRVTVVEHVPVAYGLARGRWYVVTGQGHVICDVTRSQGKEATPASAAAEASPQPSPSASATPAASDAAVDPMADATATDAATGQTTDQLAKLVAGPPAAELKIPRVILPGRPRVGASIDDKELLAALRVIEALPPRLRTRLDVVQRGDAGLTLHFAAGPVATWGDAGRTPAKITALRVVLARYDASGKACTFIDVSMPERVLARPVLE